MRTFYLVIFLLLAITVLTTAKHHLPSHKGHHGHGRRRNAAKFFGYTRKFGNSYLQNQTELANEFLHAHNWVRSQYKLPALKWDQNLASFSRKYLMEHYNDCKLVHSSSDYGENMFWGKRLHWTPSDSVYYWYQEKNWFNFATLTCKPPPKSCEHFTQIIWRDSQRVGCALQHCKNATGVLMVCEYDPAGNYEKENPLEAHANNER